MAAETKTDISLDTTEENKILLRLLREPDARTESILTCLRLVLVNQDKTAVQQVQNYIEEKLSTEMVEKAAAATPGGIPPSSAKRIQNAITISLNKMIKNGNHAEEAAKIAQFYKNIAHFSIDNVRSSGLPEQIIRMKKLHISRMIAKEMPDFFLDTKDRLEKFNHFWDGLITFSAEVMPGDKTSKKKRPLGVFKEEYPIVMLMVIICMMSIAYAYQERSPLSFLYAAMGTAMAYFLLGIGMGIQAKWLAGPVLRHLAEQEKKLCRFKYTTLKHRDNHAELALHWSDLPSLADMQKQFVALPAPAQPIHENSAEAKEGSTTRLRKKLLKQEKQSAPPVFPPPTTTTPAPTPVVDLSEMLGYSARYAGERNIGNTLFQFKATSEEDLRYVFIHPGLEAHMETEEHWTKFVDVARYTKLASKRNKQGIKTLGVQIADPETGISYPAVELKVLGKYGETRLIGAMVTIKKDNEEYNVYVFNTFWDKKALPDYFAHPLMCSSPTSAAAAVAQASAFFPPAPTAPDDLPSYDAAAQNQVSEEPLVAPDVPIPSYEEAMASDGHSSCAQ